jgi:hypothetical protein
VVVVDVDEGALRDDDGLATGAVLLDEVVPIARVVSALVDDVQAVAVVASALADPDDRTLADELDDRQLLWFAAQELSSLVAGTAD